MSMPIETDACIEQYRRDGVAMLRGAFDPVWCERLLPRARALAIAAEEEARAIGERPALRGLWRTEPLFRDYALNSGAAALAATVTGSRGVRMAIDQLWAKPPQSRRITRWHFERAGWPVTGEKLPSVWMPLTPVAAENCLEFAAGSHRWPREVASLDFVDVDAQRGEGTVQVLAWDLAVGDAVVFHPLTYHAAFRNTARDWRLAVATRWIGDDIRYAPEMPYFDEGVDFTGCVAGGELSIMSP